MDQETLDTIMAVTVAEDTLPGRMGIKIVSRTGFLLHGAAGGR